MIEDVIKKWDGEPHDKNEYIFPSHLAARRCKHELERKGYLVTVTQMQDVLFIKETYHDS